jgi:hypothetical protein
MIFRSSSCFRLSKIRRLKVGERIRETGTRRLQIDPAVVITINLQLRQSETCFVRVVLARLSGSLGGVLARKSIQQGVRHTLLTARARGHSCIAFFPFHSLGNWYTVQLSTTTSLV